MTNTSRTTELIYEIEGLFEGSLDQFEDNFFSFASEETAEKLVEIQSWLDSQFPGLKVKKLKEG